MTKRKHVCADTRLVDAMADMRIVDGIGGRDIDDMTADAFAKRGWLRPATEREWKREWRRQFREAVRLAAKEAK